MPRVLEQKTTIGVEELAGAVVPSVPVPSAPPAAPLGPLTAASFADPLPWLFTSSPRQPLASALSQTCCLSHPGNVSPSSTVGILHEIENNSQPRASALQRSLQRRRCLAVRAFYQSGGNPRAVPPTAYELRYCALVGECADERTGKKAPEQAISPACTGKELAKPDSGALTSMGGPLGGMRVSPVEPVAGSAVPHLTTRAMRKRSVRSSVDATAASLKKMALSPASATEGRLVEDPSGMARAGTNKTCASWGLPTGPPRADELMHEGVASGTTPCEAEGGRTSDENHEESVGSCSSASADAGGKVEARKPGDNYDSDTECYPKLRASGIEQMKLAEMPPGPSSATEVLPLAAGTAMSATAGLPAVPVPSDSVVEAHTVGRLHTPRQCYICKASYRRLHHFYDRLCPLCAEFNYAKRTAWCDMRGKVAVVTGLYLLLSHGISDTGTQSSFGNFSQNTLSEQPTIVHCGGGESGAQKHGPPGEYPAHHYTQFARCPPPA